MSRHVADAKSIYVPEPATLARCEAMTELERFFQVTLDSGKPLGHQPGQFVEVSVPGIGEAPISISSSPTQPEGFQLVVRNVGNVSAALHAMEPGAKVGVRGPFGTTFPYEEAKGRDVLLIAGGIGLVPVRSMINYVLDNRDDYGRVIILFGARGPAERLFVDELQQWRDRDDVEFLETVDRGDETWTGSVGVITVLIPRVDLDVKNTVAVVCGPPVMYKFVMLGLWDKKLPNDQIFVSLERRMKCGVGKCGHCQIGPYYVCQDGPVFRYSDIAHIKGAI